jgi:predicted O-methyltransferase YrrM
VTADGDAGARGPAAGARDPAVPGRDRSAAARDPAASARDPAASARWAAIEAYITATLVGQDAALDEALRDSSAAGLPAHEVPPNHGKLLGLLARVQGARSILEIGTLGGYSTIWLARALPAGGRLVTLELDERNAEVARRNMDRAGVGELVDVRVGPAVEGLRELVASAAGPFDLIFVDADKASNDEYLPLALELSRPGTLIVADNVIRGGAVADPEADDPSAQGIRRFNDLIAADPRLEATAIQTVSSKGHDGLALILVKTLNHPPKGVRPL